MNAKNNMSRMLLVLALSSSLNADAQWVQQGSAFTNAPSEMPTPDEDSGSQNALAGGGLLQQSLGGWPMPEPPDPGSDLLGSLVRQLTGSSEDQGEKLLTLYNYVLRQIRTEPYLGRLRSPERTLIDKAGSPAEQCHLLSELFRRLGVQTAFRHYIQRLEWDSPDQYDICDFTGLNDPDKAYNLLLAGGLVSTSWTVVGEKVYVYVPRVGLDINGTERSYFNPVSKYYSSIPETNLLALAGYSRSGLLSAVGGTTGTGWVKDMQEGALTNLLATYATTFRQTVSGMDGLDVPGRILEGLELISLNRKAHGTFRTIRTPWRSTSTIGRSHWTAM